VRAVCRTLKLLLLLMMTVHSVVVVEAGQPSEGARGAGADVDLLEGSAKLEAIIEKVVRRQRSIDTLRASFTQTKRSTLLLTEEYSRGELCVRTPNTVRWDYADPEAMIVLFTDNMVTTFHPAFNRAQQVKISKKQKRFVGVLAGTRPLDELIEHFRVTMVDSGAPHPYRFTLWPASGTVGKRVSRVELDIDRTLFLPVVVEYHESDGDSTRYEFREVEINPEIDDRHFELEIGAAVRIETIDASAGIG
jgi:outer membrane lipoprotein-sorting protein